MFIPGQIISLATFPGVVIHELSHLICCRIFGAEVKDVCYFRLGNPSGYVIHATCKNWLHTVAIAAGPFLFNSLLCIFLAFPVSLSGNLEENSLIKIFILWLSISIGMHSIPSKGDAKSMWQAVSGKRGSIAAKLLVAPIVGFIYLMSLGSFIWLDLIYALILAAYIPSKLIYLVD